MRRILWIVAVLAYLTVGPSLWADQASADSKRVADFFASAELTYFDHSAVVEFPNMDDETLLAANRLARQDCKRLYGDVAALMLRASRMRYEKSVTTQHVYLTYDIPRLFCARFAGTPACRGDEMKLSTIADWIMIPSPNHFASPLLDEERKLYAALELQRTSKVAPAAPVAPAPPVSPPRAPPQ